MSLFAFFFVLALAACSDQENNPIKSGKVQSQSETTANQEEVCFDHNDINSIIDILSNPSNTGGSDSNPTESCLTSDDSDVKAKQARIAERLFGLERCEADSLTHYDYNDYMASPHDDTAKCDGYLGGHSGWDVQTQSVAGDKKTADETFYSLTSGQYSAGKATDDDCAFCDLFDVFNNLEALIVSAWVRDNTPTPGQAFTLRARVQNQGTALRRLPRVR